MPSVRAEAILAAANIFWQITLAAWDNTGGSSGQDSVLAGIIATVDQSNGVLYLWALLNFITDSSLIWSGRWGMIHPTRMDRLIKTRLEITLRSHWRHIVNKSRRFAELDWIHINHESPAMSVASTPRLATELKIDFTQSLCALAVPYMLRRDGEFNLVSPAKYEVTLSGRAVENAAAKSIARFGIALSWSVVLLCARLALFIFAYGLSWWQLLIVVPAETGRAALVMCQLVSIITYSTYYKGVSTWASPHNTGPRWARNRDKQDKFRAVLLSELGCNFVAKTMFYIIERCWRWARKESLFDAIRSPTDAEYDNENVLWIRVYEDELGCKSKLLYTVILHRVPAIHREILRSALYPELRERLLVGIPLLIPIMLTIISPAVNILGAGSAVQVHLLVEQLFVSAVKYYDPCRACINTEI